MALGNTVEYATLFQDALDKQMTEVTTSAWMDANAGQVIYNGGNKVKIPKISMDGLGSYDRSTGYAEGGVTFEYQEHTFDQDRSRKFRLDSQDVDETNFVMTASTVMSEFQRTKVAPEVDAYRYSTIFGYAFGAGKTAVYTPDSSTIFAQLTSDITNVRDIVGDGEDLVVVMSHEVANTLDNADKIEKQLQVIDFASGEIYSKVRGLDDVPILRVPSARFYSDYTFGSDGFSKIDGTAVKINWIIIPRSAPIGVVKTDRPKIIDPEMNQTADAWDIAYRKYHTLWIPDNKLDVTYVSVLETVAPELTVTVSGGTASGTTSFTATAGTGNVLAYSLTTSAADGYLKTKGDYDVNPYTSGDDIAATAGQFLNMYEVDSDGYIVKFNSQELASGDITV